LSWGAALLFGALIAATDPIAVVSLFKEMKVPGRLSILVDGESLLNDAVAVVLFTVVLSVTQSGDVGSVTVGRGALAFVLVSLGGSGRWRRTRRHLWVGGASGRGRSRRRDRAVRRPRVHGVRRQRPLPACVGDHGVGRR